MNKGRFSGGAKRAEQIELFERLWRRTPEQLCDAIVRRAGCPVRLALTRNRVSMVSVRWAPTHYDVRLDEGFLDADERVTDALGDYLRKRSRTTWAVVRAYVRGLRPAPPASAPVRVQSRGRIHDLQAIRDRVNARFFNGTVRCRIGWGRLGARRRNARSRTMRFGSYVALHRLVRIHPLLDDPNVPVEFIEYIVFHEMLHAVAPASLGAGSGHGPHHAAFRRLERSYPDLVRMRRLSAELVRRLAGPPDRRARLVA